MKRFLSIIILAMILWTSLIACGERITLDEYDVADAPIAQPRNPSLLQYHAGCIYFSSDTVMRYSIHSGTLTSLCPDPLCFHNTAECPFFKVGTNPEIYGTRLFYEGVNMEDFTYVWYAYDMDSGKLRQILTEDEMVSTPVLHRGRLYYIRNVLREGEPAGDIASYDRVLCAVDADTLEKQTLCVLGHAADAEVDALLTFFGDRILWKYGTTWYTTDLDGGNRQDFGEFKNIEIRGIRCDRENGVLYCVRYTDELLGYMGTAAGPFADRRAVYRSYPVILRKDGSVTELTEIHATGIIEATADYLYYYKFGEITETSKIDGALWRCRHDGSGEECVLTAEEIGGAEICLVAGGAAYVRDGNALVKMDFATKEKSVIYTKES
ncbi:MAG: hypothetical protein ACI3XP_00570 [Eubacteriales bacterium]